MNTFILIGLLLLLAGQCYQSPREYWRMMKSTPQQIYQQYRDGRRLPKPQWAYGADALGIGLMVLGFWRLWAGV